eukprot:3657396-Alexandrium_andersonii.AAC.1
MPDGIDNIASGVRNWPCAEPNKTRLLAPKAPGGAFCVISRADSESAGRTGRRARRRRFAE